MPDTLLSHLWNHLPDLPGPHLVVADENCRDAPWASLPESTRVLSNRWDVAEQARAAGLDSRFNDFRLDTWSEPPATILYRVSKEKAVVHHVINSSLELLAPAGHLLLAGEKCDGIKGYVARAATLFGNNSVRARKAGNHYLGRLVRQPDQETGARLDDQDYRLLRQVAEEDDIQIYGKPGLFGWDRIDVGSALLARQLPKLVTDNSCERLLDLGCGSGYLAAMAARHCQEIVATDNNAAALAATERTLEANGFAGRVVAADCGDRIEPAFDLILCNPPFHQGFENSRDLTRRFLAAAARLLAPNGQALFVVNAFIPLEALSQHWFGTYQTVTADASFKVLQLRRPRLSGDG